ncbi:uncharacterized protein KGF55_003147 [Candida pseudojiufengensis]|uniref:uncharacterized protein n=1 Tax=Candida pseudojiufengensis TaxID=497109 RepID=UPI0022251891|nr:uncharacterized protein KGF55_003147 [Candida pseudojiufengensis]KAI5962072.1 hypothetical protein KGF55_003147 [Candida pseudojiufengensis]
MSKETNYSLYYEPKSLRIELEQKEDSTFRFNVTNSPNSNEDTLIKSIPEFLKNNVYIIDSVNSGSGREDLNLYTEIIKPLFSTLEIEYNYIQTKNADTINEFASTFNTPNSTIIFLSGDTSINEFVNNLKYKEHINIYPIPSGTGNSLALSLGLTSQIQAVAHLLISEKISPLFTYEVELPSNSYYLVQDKPKDKINQPLKFLVVFSWAFHASLVADSDTQELRKHGLQRFQIAAKQNLEKEQKYEANLKINDEIVEGPFAYFVLTSAEKFEPTFEISPNGNILKDELYLIAFKTGIDIMEVMMQVYDKGSHIKNSNVIYKKIYKDDKLELDILFSKDLIQRRFCLDGSIIALPETENHKIKIKTSSDTNLYIIH